MQTQWNTHGDFTFLTHEILEEANRNELFDRENFWMDTLRTSGLILFNNARAGAGWNKTTFDNKDQIGKKISSTLKTLAQSLSEDERKIKWGKGKKGIPLTEEHKRKTSIGLKGRKKTEETKRRMSLAQKMNVGNKRESMSRIGKSNIGKTPANANRIIIDEKIYNSGADAMRALGITSRQLHKMVLDGKARKAKTS